MAPEITLRPGTPSDAALLAGMGLRTFLDAYLANNAEGPLRAFAAQRYGLAQQTAELADPAVRFLLASVGGEPAGYAMLREGGNPAVTGERPVELARLYVEQRWTGRGVGSALMRACLEQSKQRGHDVIWLSVWEHNPRAETFYEGWGFRRVGFHYFLLGDELQIDLDLMREL